MSFFIFFPLPPAFRLFLPRPPELLLEDEDELLLEDEDLLFFLITSDIFSSFESSILSSKPAICTIFSAHQRVFSSTEPLFTPFSSSWRGTGGLWKFLLPSGMAKKYTGEKNEGLTLKLNLLEVRFGRPFTFFRRSRENRGCHILKEKVVVSRPFI